MSDVLNAEAVEALRLRWDHSGDEPGCDGECVIERRLVAPDVNALARSHERLRGERDAALQLMEEAAEKDNRDFQVRVAVGREYLRRAEAAEARVVAAERERDAARIERDELKAWLDREVGLATAEIASLRAAVRAGGNAAALAEALEFYADEANYNEVSLMLRRSPADEHTAVDNDRGRLAREALALVPDTSLHDALRETLELVAEYPTNMGAAAVIDAIETVAREALAALEPEGEKTA